MYKQASYKNSVLHYQCVGKGATVVLLHGFGEDGTVWDFQKDALQPHFQLIIPDLPGSGRSPLMADVSMEALADAVSFILEQEGIKSCVLIGHSMGGYITLAFAERHAATLNGFGLFHSSAFTDDAEKIATRKKGIAFIREHGAYAFLKTASPNLYSPATKEQKPSLIEQQVAASAGFSDEALIAYYEAMLKRPDRTEVLRHATVPVLFIMGRHDTAIPLQASLAQCYVPQLAYIHLLDQSGHMGMHEEPKISNAILNQYLSETVRLP